MTENKQLFEKQSNSYSPIYPLVRLEDIIDTIGDKSIQWILNNYNHIYVEYSESKAVTRNKVPQLLRRTGIWISYNAGTEVVTEYYKGDNKDVTNFIKWTNDDNWERFDKIKHLDGSITYQHLSESLKQLIGQGNNITNFPDDEDLEVKDGLLKFKDRDFEPNNFSGLGRVILRKNIKTVNGQPKNVLTQDMINKSNTVYEIRYDFDLNSAEITIPEGCVLDFQGGSLSNGIIIYNNTKVIGDYFNKINVECQGLATNEDGEVLIGFYGAKGNEVSDDTVAIQNAFNAVVNYRTIKFSRGRYIVSDTITIPSIWKRVKVYGDNAVIKAKHNGDCIVFEQSNIETGNISISDISLEGTNPAYASLKNLKSKGVGLKLIKNYHNNFVNVRISGFKYGLEMLTGIGNSFDNNCYFRFNEIGVYMHGSAINFNTFGDCSIRENYLCGLSINSDDATNSPALQNVFSKCLIESNGPYIKEERTEENGIGVKLKYASTTCMDNCYFENNGTTAIDLDGYAINSRFSNCRFCNGNIDVRFGNSDRIRNNLFIGCSEESVNNESIVLLGNSTELITNRFVCCSGFKFNSFIDRSNIPSIQNYSDVNYKSSIYDRLSIGNIHQNPSLIENPTDDFKSSTTNPFIDATDVNNAIIYTRGYGGVQLGSLITKPITVGGIVGLKPGDIFVVDFGTCPQQVTFQDKYGFWLNDAESCTLRVRYEQIVFYANYLGQVTELSRVIRTSKRGASSLRPTLYGSDRGYQYYDYTLNKPIYWSGSKWIDVTGADV